jgi:hypothetical protein
MIFGALKDVPQVKCLVLQKDTNHYCKAKIISKRTNCGIHPPCYVGNWNVVKCATIELHKFWFHHDDQNCYFKGVKRKYAINMSIVPTIWVVQKGINLIQDEVTTFEKTDFLDPFQKVEVSSDFLS